MATCGVVSSVGLCLYRQEFSCTLGISASDARVKRRVWEGGYGITRCFQSLRKRGAAGVGLLWVCATSKFVFLRREAVLRFLPVRTLVSVWLGG